MGSRMRIGSPIPRAKGLCILGLLIPVALAAFGEVLSAAPNIVMLVADDLGYGDLGCYGAADMKTPNLNRLSSEGVRLTNFYDAASVCSASSAALWTGRYPCRVSVGGDLRPESTEGLASYHLTLAEVVAEMGYVTGMLGKWHLGSRPEFLPTRQGFERFYGIPYSHDVQPVHTARSSSSVLPNLPLYDGGRIVELNPDMAEFTVEITQRAVQFIHDNSHRPFLLCVAYPMPQVPLAVSRQFEGTTDRGLYGDVVAELDWSVGEILDALAGSGLDTETLVVFTSDSGPALEYGDQAGSAGVLRGGKGSTFEGGMRVPCLVRWTGKIPPGTVSEELVVNFDWVPTCSQLAGAVLPPGMTLDGRDIWPILALPTDATSPHRCFYYYSGGALHAIRSGRWKLHFPHGYTAVSGPPAADGQPARTSWQRIGLSLFDLEEDPGETTNVAEQNEEIVSYLKQLAEVAREDLGDSLTRRTPSR